MKVPVLRKIPNITVKPNTLWQPGALGLLCLYDNFFLPCRM